MSAATQQILVLIPVYNDWASLRTLLAGLDGALAESGLQAEALVVNDASDEGEMALLGDFQALTGVQVLDLRRNLGHQRAIAIGLAHIEANMKPGPVLVMDGDGEDDPKDVPKLVKAYREHGGSRLIFARRGKRYEGWLFRSLYNIYQLAYFLLTGHRMNVGNFSIIPPHILRRLIIVSEIWNHYAASVIKARIPHGAIPLARGKRISGRSKMSFVALIAHGLSSISVHADMAGSRMLVLATILMLLAFCGIVVVVILRLATDLAIPGWATSAAGLLAILIMQAGMLSLLFMLLMLSGRNALGFIPSRDYAYFIDRVYRVYPGEEPDN